MSEPTLTAFIAGVAGLLDAAGVGVWDESRTWGAADSEYAIVDTAVGQVPPRLIALTAYFVASTPGGNDSMIALQARIRGDENPASARDKADAIALVLDNLRGGVIGGIPVVLMWLQSANPLPADANQRREYAANYYARVAWIASNRLDD